MNERINNLTKLTLNGDMYVEPVHTEFYREDMFLTKSERDVKRIYEYILNQKTKITKYSKFTGFFKFDGSVIGDAFGRSGHKATEEVLNLFYLKPADNLSTMEWQHATADYKRVPDKGISEIICDIDRSLAAHNRPEEIEFPNGLKQIAQTVIKWAKKMLCGGS